MKINALFDVAFRFNIGNASHSTRSRGCVATAALYCGQIQENRFRKVEDYLDMKVNQVLIHWKFLGLDSKIIFDVRFFIVAPTPSCLHEKPLTQRGCILIFIAAPVDVFW